MYIMSDNMYETMSISTGLYPKLDLWNTYKLQLLSYAALFVNHIIIIHIWEQTTIKIVHKLYLLPWTNGLKIFTKTNFIIFFSNNKIFTTLK